jgi:hypothetical protein
MSGERGDAPRSLTVAAGSCTAVAIAAVKEFTSSDRTGAARAAREFQWPARRGFLLESKPHEPKSTVGGSRNMRAVSTRLPGRKARLICWRFRRHSGVGAGAPVR